MFEKNKVIQRVVSVIVILTIILTGIQLPSASAQDGGDDLKREINAETGKISFISSENTPSLLADRVNNGKPRSDDPAMDLARQYAPEFGVQDPERDLIPTRTQELDNGRVTVKYQQKYDGIPIMGGELIVNTNDYGDLYSMNGEVSPNISLSTQPTIDSNRAQETALQAVAKWYQASKDDFDVSDPELWIFDESLLKPSDRPVELVWRMEVTSRDGIMPVRELVLVNAYRGGISLHFNQIDEAWGETQPKKAAQSTTSKPDVATPKVTDNSSAKTTKDLIPNLLGNTWYVATTGNDANSCSSAGSPCATINGAIEKATGGDTILVTVGTYTFPSNGNCCVVIVNKNLNVYGGWNVAFSTQIGFSTIDGQEAYGGVDIYGNVIVYMERFVVKNSTFGVNVESNSSNTLTLNRVSVYNNSSTGIHSSGNVIIDNSTISNNKSPGGSGGGIYQSSGTLNLNNTTVSNNLSDYGGGIYIYSGIINITNSIVANNSVNVSGPDCYGAISSNGNNIFGDISGCTITAATGDQFNIDPGLGSFLPEQGYYPLLPTSPAINAGQPSSCLSTDQRGIARPQGAVCDIGAYEYTSAGTASSIWVVSGNNQRSEIQATFPIPLQVAVLDSQGSPVSSTNVTFTAPGSGASGIFESTSTNTTSVITDAGGIATTSSFIANNEAGVYDVSASAGGVGSVDFSLQNTAWYVATTGDDSNSCSSPISACLTINEAISKAGDGDRIKVALGTYTDSGTEVVLANKNITLSGGWNTDFSSQIGVSTIDGQVSRRGVTVYFYMTVFIERFVIQNGFSDYGGGINIADGIVTLNDSVISDNGGNYIGSGIYNTGDGKLTLNNTIVSNNTGGGINNYIDSNSSNTTILNNSTVSNNGNTGITNSGYLILNSSTISNNSNGGIYNHSFTATINNSTISDNTSGSDGGGIHNHLGTLIVNNSTISGNSTLYRGGGISIFSGAATISNSTISNNTTISTIYGGGGLYYGSSGSITMQNTVLADNATSGSGPDCNGDIDSLGYNLIGNMTGCNFNATTGDKVGTNSAPIDPRLAPLQDNGGFTFTHALMEGSPAIDAGNPATCLPTDQRGVARPVGAKCDIGAYEGSVSWIPNSLVRTYKTNNSSKLPGTLLCNQTQPTCPSGDNHAKKAHQYALGVYNLYATKHLRDSIDNNGMIIKSTVHYNKKYANAFWDGKQLVYGDAYGFPLADDIVGHEYTHGVTQYESNLFPYYQSGAISESISDLWGEYYDQTNGLGNDTAAVKWLLGEDTTGLGAVRNMKNPPQFGDPDKMSSPNYIEDITDNGGIHHNSGVNNKAVFLMVDGGSFNGKTITKLGWDKTAAIYYEANTNLLTSGSDYSDLYFALQQACSNLVGQKGITSANCVQVKNTLLAVEMNAQPAPNFNPEAAFCPNGLSTGDALNLFQDDFENGSAKWTPQPAWKVEDWYATSPIHMFYGDDTKVNNDSSLKMKTRVAIPAGSKAFLHFNHAFLFDYVLYQGQNYYFDGGVLEYSINNGSTWTDAKSLFSAGQNYKGKIENYQGTTNKLKGRDAFVGDSHGYVSSLYDLGSLAGKKVQFRWRLATDSEVSFLGWFVDDVQIYTCIGKPSKPVLSSPATNALVTDYTPDLDWSDSTPAPVTYQIQIADNNAFTSPVYSQKNLSTSDFSVPTDLAPNTKYYWRVRAINALNKPGAWSTTFTFRTVMVPPVLLTPTEGETIATLQPLLDWEDTVGATKYVLQVSDTSDFSNMLINLNNLTSSEYQIPSDLSPAITYYWRVRALGPNGPSDWSSVFSFTTP